MHATAITPEVRHARRAYAWVALIIPFIATASATTLTLLWLPDLPDTVAIHWTSDGPDGFMPSAVAPFLVAGAGLFLTLVFGVFGLASSRRGEWGPTLRFLGAVGLGATLLVVTTLTMAFGIQRGVDDPGTAPGVALPLLVGVATGVFGGLVAWFAQPKVTTSRPESVPASTVALAAGERVTWLRTTTMAPGAMIALIAVVVMLGILSLVFAVMGIELWWLLAILALVVLAIVLSTFVFRVRVNENGLRAASLLGLPRVRIPLRDIASVRVTHITPFAEFGGWGFRLSPDGRLGIVMRTGDAIEVTRTNGRTFVVTVSDAVTGAGLLSALVQGQHAPSGDS